MLKTWLGGGLLILAAIAVVILSDLFDLELEAVALLGVAMGAIVALVPDRSAAGRLVGFATGFAAAFIGYLVRAGVLPDSLGGRIITVALILGICVLVAGAAHRFVPLWATLLGAAAVVGAYEYSYTAAPPEVLSTSITTVTSLLMTSAIGFLVAALVLPAPREERPASRHGDSSPDEDTHPLSDMMEKSK